MRIAVIGAGALGSFYGGKLAQAGYPTQFQSKNSYNVLKRKNLTVKSIWGDFKIKPDMHENTETMNPADIIIFSTKALPEINVRELILPCLKKKKNEMSIIICLQNGINQEERLKKMFPRSVILGALAFACIHRVSYHEVHHVDYGLLKVAPLKRDHLKQAERVIELFSGSGIECELGEHLRELRWHKLLWNIPFNSLSVLLGGANTSEMVEDHLVRKLLVGIMEEIVKIAGSDGISISKKAIKDMIHRTKKMEPYKTSMLLDYEQGRPLEVEAILGEALRIAQKKKIDATKIDMLYKMLIFIQKNLKKSNFYR